MGPSGFSDWWVQGASAATMPKSDRTHANGCGSKPMGSHSGVGEFATHFRTDFSGWIGDVH